ncbi:hypothetical protein LRS10_13695 [Phenylobacterium sp. J426]|uniref:hypothetical protein n=1 Tax=Phenylobacterium sp. J426 TaxID=2898439 RepID=UPI0021507CC5|nr:hypothetical protein [Phenylobacterium sp. J426]MCR5875147.1 hypothetical protein [Phenylobacterium sp. J426]
MKALATRRAPTPAERQKRAIADRLGDQAFAAFLDRLPPDPVVRRRASERLTRLLGAFVADGHGEAALHCALAGAVVAGAPAFQSEPKTSAAEALFRKGEG